MQDRFERTSHVNRAAFLAGTLAAAAAAAPQPAWSSAPAAPAEQASPQELLGRLMAGNRRFLNNDFPPLSTVAQKREALTEMQAPFAAVVSCSDSRVIPNFVFVQGMGDLFVVRVAGNFPDDLGVGSLEYTVEHLGSKLIMIVGHENCGAIKAVYSSIKEKKPLPPHLSAIERVIAPGIKEVVNGGGSMNDAVTANVRAGVALLKSSPPVLSKAVEEGSILIVGGFYHLATGEVTVIR